MISPSLNDNTALSFPLISSPPITIALILCVTYLLCHTNLSIYLSLFSVLPITRARDEEASVCPFLHLSLVDKDRTDITSAHLHNTHLVLLLSWLLPRGLSTLSPRMQGPISISIPLLCCYEQPT